MQYQRHVVFWVAALVIVIALLWLLSPILLPFVLGMAIAYLLNPLATRLSKRGVNRVAAALMILGGFVLALAILVLIISPRLVGQITEFTRQAPQYAQKLQAVIGNLDYPWLKSIFGANFKSDITTGGWISEATGYLSSFLLSLWSTGRTLISLFSLLIITPVVAFYLLCDWERIVAAVDRLIPLPQRDTVRALAREIDTAISAYVRGQTGVCLILGSYYALVLKLAGLNFSLLIGVLSGLISFIPYVGSLTALVLSLAVAAAQFQTEWVSIVIVAGLVLIGQFFEGNVLAPKLVGHSVGLHPVWLMFALFAFGYLFGFVGLLLAVPLAAAAGVLVRFAVRRYRESPIYTGAPQP